MRRVSRAASGGVTVEGLYRQLVEREREAHTGPAAVDAGEDAPAVYRRPETLLRALEAGRPVLVQRSSVRLAYWYLTGERQDPFPWHRSVRVVQVTPDDVVTSSDREIPWYGCGVDEFANGLRGEDGRRV